MSEWHIRAVDETDIPAVREIYNHYVRTATVTFDEIDSTLEFWTHKHAAVVEAGIPFLVAETDAGELLGYALGMPWSVKSAYRFTIENSIYLAPSAVGRGVGRVLLDAFLDACREAGFRQVIAVIADSGADASIGLHSKAGFAEAGRLTQVGEKFGELLGVRFMQKALAE